jgi:serine protease Do
MRTSLRSIPAVAAIAAVTLLAAQAVSPAAARGGLPDFTELVQSYGPAVVNISTTQKKQIRSPHRLPKGLEIPDIPEDSPFYEFFRRFFGEGGEAEEYDAQSLGSGFLLSTDGYVVTNHHVVKDAEEVIVRLSDRRELTAEVVGSDERSDIAVLKVKGDGFPSVKLGRSADLRVGEWVLAIGSPFGFDHSVTAGIVSAIGRSLPSENYVPFIQTDVAINPGNSGGPLFNLDGEVVGVNSQIYSRTGGFMGLSFAIPIDVAMDVVEQIKSHGKVSRGWLGVLIQDVTRELAESFGMERPHGALVARVLPDSPASAAGFAVGDVVVEFDGKPVAHSSDLPPMVGRTRAGSKVPVKVLREGKPKTLTVAIAELPEDTEVQARVGGHGGPSSDQRLGVAVTDLTPEQREELEVGEGGVLVAEVKDGAAHRAGVRQGDVILMIDGVGVKNAVHFKELAAGLEGEKPVPLLVQRRGNPLFLALRLK